MCVRSSRWRNRTLRSHRASADIVALHEEDDTVSSLVGDGAGAFEPAASYPVGSGARALTAADFDGDVDIDLAVTDIDSNTVAVLRNQGAGALAAPEPYAVGEDPQAVTTADVEGDGDGDVDGEDQPLDRRVSAACMTSDASHWCAPSAVRTSEQPGGDMNRNRQRSEPRTAALVLLGLAMMAGCSERTILNGNFSAWPDRFATGGEIPGDPSGDRVQISPDQSTTHFVATKLQGKMLLGSGVSCSRCDVRFYPVSFAGPARTLVQWDFAFQDLDFGADDQALLVSIANAEAPDAPIIRFRFGMQGRNKITHVLHGRGTAVINGHPSRSDTVKVLIAPTSDGLGSSWFDGMPELRRIGVVPPIHPVSSGNLIVTVRFEHASAPDNSLVWFTKMEMQASERDGS